MPGGVVAEDLVKRFGSFVALKGVDFVAPEGRVTGWRRGTVVAASATVGVNALFSALSGAAATDPTTGASDPEGQRHRSRATILVGVRPRAESRARGTSP